MLPLVIIKRVKPNTDSRLDDDSISNLVLNRVKRVSEIAGTWLIDDGDVDDEVIRLLPLGSIVELYDVNC